MCVRLRRVALFMVRGRLCVCCVLYNTPCCAVCCRVHVCVRFRLICTCSRCWNRVGGRGRGGLGVGMAEPRAQNAVYGLRSATTTTNRPNSLSALLFVCISISREGWGWPAVLLLLCACVAYLSLPVPPFIPSLLALCSPYYYYYYDLYIYIYIYTSIAHTHSLYIRHTTLLLLIYYNTTHKKNKPISL